MPLQASAQLWRILDGVLWSGVQTVLGRIVTFGGQLLLAYLLAPADFGLFAMATAVSAIILQFQDIGLGQVLLQRRERHVIHAEHILPPGFVHQNESVRRTPVKQPQRDCGIARVR